MSDKKTDREFAKRIARAFNDARRGQGMRTVKRSDLPASCGIPLFLIPRDTQVAEEVLNLEHVLCTVGPLDDRLFVSVFYIDPSRMKILDEDGSNALEQYRVKYHPTSDEVVTALTGPVGPVGPQGAKGDSA